jgi:hypothetical protein
MPAGDRPATKRGIDALGVLFALLLIGVVSGAAYAALELGWFRSAWELAAWIVVGVAFIAVGIGVHHHRPSKNANVYGAAKTASEAEAQAAARGNMKSASLHDQTFRD